VSSPVATRLQELSERYGLPDDAAPRLTLFLDLLAAEPTAITSVRDPAQGVETHVADSLVALEIPAVREARAIADLGSGGGLPGLPLAVALPSATVRLVESASRKCAFLEVVADRLGATNVEVVRARAEAWPEGLRRHDLVTARALAPMNVLLEYAAPLLSPAGSLVAWKGPSGGEEEPDGAAAAGVLGMSRPVGTPVEPFHGARGRMLYLSSKVAETPERFPRRAGMARKRPLLASTGR
jgi:16S rRNA (guanine527-N7)-methyltransferase